MKSTFNKIMSFLILSAVLLAACGPSQTKSTQPAQAQPTQPASSAGDAYDPANVTGNIITAGSSTVFPLSEAVADLFREEGFSGEITIDSIGSGAGFERFCTAGETDISNASRAIKDSEVEACKAIGREPIQFRVGTDGLAIVVSQANDFLQDVTLEELAKIFSKDATNWSDVNPAWPNEAILRYSPGTDSGTFDYFVEGVMEPVYGKDAAKEAILKASSISLSEDDNVLVHGVEGSPYAIGYFGYAYYEENQAKLKAVSVDGISPNVETVTGGTYPLARPLYLYSDAKIMKEKPQVAAFIKFYLENVNDVISNVGYFPEPDASRDEALQAWADALK